MTSSTSSKLRPLVMDLAEVLIKKGEDVVAQTQLGDRKATLFIDRVWTCTHSDGQLEAVFEGLITLGGMPLPDQVRVMYDEAENLTLVKGHGAWRLSV